MSSLLNAEWPEIKAVRSAEANLLSHCILQQSWNNNNNKKKSNGNNHSNWEERKHYSCSRDKQQGQEIHKHRPAGVTVEPRSVLSTGKHRPVLKHQCAHAVGATPRVWKWPKGLRKIPRVLGEERGVSVRCGGWCLGDGWWIKWCPTKAPNWPPCDKNKHIMMIVTRRVKKAVQVCRAANTRRLFPTPTP